MNETSRTDKKVVMKCFTCLICNNLFDQATTIVECLHTFCRKCIHDKITEENLRACPVCNVDLGVAPLDKLRTDNTLSDLRLKVFPPTPKSVKRATKTAATRKRKGKKKERTLPSLLASSCRASTSGEQSNHDAPLEPEKLAEEVEAVTQIQSSAKPLNEYRRRRKNPMPQRINDKEGEINFEILLNIEQDNGLVGAGTSEGWIQKEKNAEKDNEELPIASDLCKSLSNDMEVTPLKSSGTEEVEPAISLDGNQNLDSGRSGGDTEKVFGEVEQNTVVVISDGETEEVFGEKPNNTAKENQEPVHGSGDQKLKGKAYSPPVLRSRKARDGSSAGTSQNAISNQVEGRNKVWFSLAACKNQHTDRPLQEIPTVFLHVNGNLPVSYVKKYVANKLNLESEDEVEIWIRTEPVCSTQLLQTLVDWWVQTTPISEQRSAIVGSSGEDFVMKLYYSRSHLYP